jgi:hypothetical protein
MPAGRIAEEIKHHDNGGGVSCIYALTCVETGAVRYIGKADCPEKRLKSHMRDAKRRNTPLYSWIKKHGRPNIVVLATGCVDWVKAEREAISFARSIGVQLLNLADGGDQPLQRDAESLAEGARKMNQKRPMHVMRAYRKLESNVRFMERLHGVPYEKGRSAIEKLSNAVDVCRRKGSLAALDAMISKTTLGAA